MSITHDVERGVSHVPRARVLLPWGCQKLRAQFEYECAQIRDDGHYRRGLPAQQRAEDRLPQILSMLIMQVVQASHLKNNQRIKIQYKIINTIQWNPVNTDTKETCRSVGIIRVSVLIGLSEKRPGHMFYRYKD